MKKVEVDWGIHFFVDDIDLERFYNNTEREKYLLAFARAKYVLTPDFSLFPEMPLLLQQVSVFKGRYCGACWQSHKIHITSIFR